MTESNLNQRVGQGEPKRPPTSPLQLLREDPQALESLELPLDRTEFTTRLLTDLVGSLQVAIGEEATTAFIDAVGLRTGEAILSMYRSGLGPGRLSLSVLASILVDLKRRIDGDFRIVSVDEDQIVLSNHACPFGSLVRGRPSLCAMTSNVFGTIVSETDGYARVELSETIASGSPGCRVLIHLKADPEAAVDGVRTREYFGLEG